MEIVYIRNGKEITSSIVPKLTESTDLFGNKIKAGLIGIKSSKVKYDSVGPGSAIAEAVYQSYNLSKTTLIAVGQIITGKRSSDEVSGILRIGKYSGRPLSKASAPYYGLWRFFQ